MNYKQIIKSRSLRLKILRVFSFVPDETMLKIQYRIKTGNKLDLKNPQRFTEKIQWYKLYYKDPKMIQCVDKYEVRKYVEQRGLKNILIPCYGVYDSINEINWEKLPNQFVMKDTLGGGGTSVEIIKDKGNINIEVLKKKAAQWLNVKPYQKNAGREWPYYSGKKHRILFEKYIHTDPHKGGLIDYKFFCFNGKVAYIYVIADRKMGMGAELGIYDSDFNLLNVTRMDEKPLKRFIKKPSNYEKLKSVAEHLSEGFPEVRVDLYNVDENILFGEMTFFDGSGYMTFDPDHFDYDFGKVFTLPPRENTF